VSPRARLILLILAGAVSVAAGAVAALSIRIEMFARSRPAPVRSAAIVVLGAKVLDDGSAGPTLRRRAEKGAELYNQGVAPVLIFSGGVIGTVPSEASVARDLVVKLGVPAEACVLEDQSHSTFDNAQLTARLLRERKIAEVVLVSDGYHLYRAMLQFRRAGIRTQCVATARLAYATDEATAVLREAVVMLLRPAVFWR
jgi:uncharacterized SAM-binding protein YcdF (DUF218 family)